MQILKNNIILSCFIVLFLNFNYSISQNLVINPSFENVYLKHSFAIDYQYKSVDTSFYEPENVFGANSSPDFINTSQHQCVELPPNDKEPIIFRKYLKNTQPRTGKNCVGIYVSTEHNEFVQLSLSTPLKPRKIYMFSMFCKPVLTKTAYYTSSIGMKTNSIPLSAFKLSINSGAYEQTVGNDTDRYFTQNKWYKIEKKFIAQGGEKYIIIGNFLDKNNSHFKKQERKEAKKAPKAYLLIDDVSLFEYEETNFQNIKKGEKIKLNNIFFNVNDFNLLPESYLELNRLVNFLIKNPNLNIKIDGYTDNTGTEQSNLILSTKRAESVKNYLIKNGISKNRISSEGHGSKMNKYPNDTPANRAKNRRVEISFY